MEARELSRDDYALRSRPEGDDLDRKTSRTGLELAALRADVEAWRPRLAKVESIMRHYLDETYRQQNAWVLRLLDGDDAQDANPAFVADAMEMAGGRALAREILTNCAKARRAVEAFLEQRTADYDNGAVS